jgi:hypothetical protein
VERLDGGVHHRGCVVVEQLVMEMLQAVYDVWDDVREGEASTPNSPFRPFFFLFFFFFQAERETERVCASRLFFFFWFIFLFLAYLSGGHRPAASRYTLAFRTRAEDRCRRD